LNSDSVKENVLSISKSFANSHKSIPFRGCIFTLFLLVLAAAPWGPAPAAAQNGSAQALFEQSLILYRNGNYEGARQTLLNARDKYASTPHLSKIYLLLSAVSEKLGDDNQAGHYARKLIRQFPNSRYRDSAEFALARLSYQDSEPLEALVHLLTIIDRSQSPALVETAKLTGSHIVAQGVSEKGLDSYLSDFPRAASRNWLLFWLARQEYGLGRRSEGDLWLQRLQMNAPELRLQRLVQELKQKPQNDALYSLRIGLILPLSGFEAGNGYDFLRGVALALQDQPQAVELVLKDSGSNLKQGVQAMQALLESRVDLVIGELAGDRSAAMAALAVERNIPMLVPVSSDNGIAAMGPNLFQMASDIETRGAALADYAYNSLGLRTFVSLAPADEYGQALSDAFANAVDRLGGTIVAQQWYYPGTQDVSRQFAAIRESAANFSPRDSLTTPGFLDGTTRLQRDAPDFSYTRPARRPAPPNKDKDDEDLSRVGSIDGFFMPAYAEDISIVAPQFSLANIQAIPLGGDDWLHADILQAQRRYLDGAVFCAGSYAEETSMEYIQFKNRFRMATSSTPGPLALAGYDVTRLIAMALKSGNRTAAQVTAWLSTLKEQNGIGNSYSFAVGKRVNQEVAILQFKNGVITRLQP
jgi:branched-chain amino acid transport system substrate-binding protein